MEKLHPLQKAFVEKGAIQCGFCTPGMILTAKAFLDENPHPSEEEVKKAISGNLCRCTGYVKIVEAILSVSEDRDSDSHLDKTITTSITIIITCFEVVTLWLLIRRPRGPYKL